MTGTHTSAFFVARFWCYARHINSLFVARYQKSLHSLKSASYNSGLCTSGAMVTDGHRRPCTQMIEKDTLCFAGVSLWVNGYDHNQ